MIKKLIVISILLMTLSLGKINADVPETINYQGYAKDGNGNLLQGTNHTVVFKLYTQLVGGTSVWGETHNNVNFTDGIYSLKLGSISSFDQPPLNSDFSKQYFLSVEIDGDIIEPRLQFSSVPYALRAKDGTPKGAIMLWTGTSCPVGYRRATELDGLFPRGADSYSGGYISGADSHDHGGSVSSEGDHSHTFSGTTGTNTQTLPANDAMADKHAIAPIWHTHQYSGDTSTSVKHSHNISSSQNVPRHFNVIFCIKE